MKKKLIVTIFLILPAFLTAQLLDNFSNNSSILGTATISVTIGGDFPVPGSFPAAISERVDQFVTRMYVDAKQQSVRNTSDANQIKEIESRLNNYSLGGIILKRNTGEEIDVDLEKFRITGNFIYNPYLKNDDVLIFPANNINRDFFTVQGAVNKPGLFYFVEGDSLNDALELSMGINEAFESIGGVSISRLSYDGTSMTTDTVNINSNIRLRRGDQIKVLAPENRRIYNAVLVFGEVNNPGSFPITKNNTKLADIINAAGGFTKEASLKRAKLYSKNSLTMLLENEYNISLSDQPLWENNATRNLIVNLETMLMYRMSNIYPDDSSYFFLENQLRVLIESSSFDFNQINDPESDISNYTVQNGDVIIIPPIINSVYVFGQIADPGYIPLREGMDYKYYIREAGGLGELAIEDEIMVIKGGSRAWVSPVEQNVVLEEGDYLYIPKHKLRTFRSYASEYAIYIQMLSSIATVLLLIITAFK
jgi:protein involved in polysaccharide export with SLBB domain